MKVTKFQSKIILASLAVLALAVAATVAKANPVSAAAVMKISPVANAVYIEAGGEQNYQFTLENTGSEDFKFRLYTAPYNVTNEDYDVDFSTSTSYNQITRWITFQDDSGSFVSEPTLSLKAGEKRTIIYRISVPNDIPDGGQYCIIFAESISDSDSDSGAVSVGLSSVSRVSLIILGHGNGDTRGTSEITDFSLTGFFTTGEIESTAKVKNTGNTDFLAVYSLAIDSLFGTPLYSATDNFVVLPGTERKFTTSWGDTPAFGVFRAKFSVEAVDQNREESRIILIMPAFVIVIMLLLLTSIVVWTIILIRKRKERSSRLVV